MAAYLIGGLVTVAILQAVAGAVYDYVRDRRYARRHGVTIDVARRRRLSGRPLLPWGWDQKEN